jgi:hypothetical protein
MAFDILSFYVYFRIVNKNILMQPNSYYQILDVHENASDDEIRKAYRTKAKLFHPDVNRSPDAHSKFVLITNAYEILINKGKRQRYDYKKKYAGDPFKAYNEWVRVQKIKAEYEARLRYYEFLKKRERFRRNSFVYYRSLAFVYFVTGMCFFIGTFVIAVCSILVFNIHPIWFFFLLPFICGGVYLIKSSLDWYKDTKRYF